MLLLATLLRGATQNVVSAYSFSERSSSMHATLLSPDSPSSAGITHSLRSRDSTPHLLLARLPVKALPFRALQQGSQKSWERTTDSWRACQHRHGKPTHWHALRPQPCAHRLVTSPPVQVTPAQLPLHWQVEPLQELSLLPGSTAFLISSSAARSAGSRAVTLLLSSLSASLLHACQVGS
jgi:hypothetical protein